MALAANLCGAMIETSYLSALVGGVVIGLAGSFLLVFNGRVAGVSSVVGGALQLREGDLWWRVLFVAGLVLGGVVLALVDPSLVSGTSGRGPGILVVAGLLVGAGSRLGSGCTSGHGVCGMSSPSKRSLVATVVFVGVGMLTASLMSFAAVP
jgi:uncharacterized membrane protein YedE/YeeE